MGWVHMVPGLPLLTFPIGARPITNFQRTNYVTLTVSVSVTIYRNHMKNVAKKR